MLFTIHFILTSILLSVTSILFSDRFISASDYESNDINYLEHSKYSFEERLALEKFRPLVQDVLKKDYEMTDTFLIRWLRACDLNLIAANAMLRENQRWRIENKMDTILNETTIEIKGNPCILEGTDLEGNPLAIVTLIGHHDIRKLVVAGNGNLMVRFMNQFLEKTETKIRELAAATGKDITQAVTLVDASGYNLKQHACFDCIKMYLEFLRNFEKYFPELNRYVVIINTPMIAKPFIEMVKPILSKNSQRAVKLFGMDRKEWSRFLLSIVAPDQLPIQFGGTKNLQFI